VEIVEASKLLVDEAEKKKKFAKVSKATTFGVKVNVFEPSINDVHSSSLTKHFAPTQQKDPTLPPLEVISS